MDDTFRGSAVANVQHQRFALSFRRHVVVFNRVPLTTSVSGACPREVTIPAAHHEPRRIRVFQAKLSRFLARRLLSEVRSTTTTSGRNSSKRTIVPQLARGFYDSP